MHFCLDTGTFVSETSQWFLIYIHTSCLWFYYDIIIQMCFSVRFSQIPSNLQHCLPSRYITYFGSKTIFRYLQLDSCMLYAWLAVLIYTCGVLRQLHGDQIRFPHTLVKPNLKMVLGPKHAVQWQRRKCCALGNVRKTPHVFQSIQFSILRLLHDLYTTNMTYILLGNLYTIDIYTTRWHTLYYVAYVLLRDLYTSAWLIYSYMTYILLGNIYTTRWLICYYVIIKWPVHY
jgi:hypothetical protein